MIGHDVLRAHGRAVRALTAYTLLLFLAPSGANACPPATPADYAMFPSTLRTIQPEPLIAAGTPTACPGATNTSPCGAHQVYVPALNNPERQAEPALPVSPRHAVGAEQIQRRPLHGGLCRIPDHRVVLR